MQLEYYRTSLLPGGGGVWSSVNCALVTSSTGQLQCRCLHVGSYAVLDVRMGYSFECKSSFDCDFTKDTQRAILCACNLERNMGASALYSPVQLHSQMINYAFETRYNNSTVYVFVLYCFC